MEIETWATWSRQLFLPPQFLWETLSSLTASVSLRWSFFFFLAEATYPLCYSLRVALDRYWFVSLSWLKPMGTSILILSCLESPQSRCTPCTDGNCWSLNKLKISVWVWMKINCPKNFAQRGYVHVSDISSLYMFVNICACIKKGLNAPASINFLAPTEAYHSSCQWSINRELVICTGSAHGMSPTAVLQEAQFTLSIFCHT